MSNAVLEHDKVQHLESKITQQAGTIQYLKSHISQLEEALKLALIQKYGRSSERQSELNPAQGLLFEADELDALNPDDTVIEEDNNGTEIAAHQRKSKRGYRKPLPDCIPREIIIHELPESELMGENGEQYVKIGEEITEQLDIVPATVKVLHHIRYKYAVNGIEELGVKIAPLPIQPIPKSMAAPGLLAHMVQAKFCHHLPLYRQESIWQSLDVHLPRNSMCRWMRTLGEMVLPIVEEIMEQMKSEVYIQADETPVTVINDDKKKSGNASHKGYMWVYVNQVGMIYDYQSSRAGMHPLALLEEFEGYIQSDAYSGYNILFSAESSRQSVGCWAHARRKFTDIAKASGKKNPKSYTHQIIKMIGKLYQIEKTLKARHANVVKIQAIRQEQSIPILSNIKSTLDSIVTKTPPKGLLGKAIAYSLNHWQALCRYTENGHLDIDNNAAERAVKPFVIGRKNWLFAGNTQSAKASANLFTLIENAKLYDLKVFEYLRYVFNQIGEAKSVRDYEQLTPKFAQEHVPKLKDLTQNKSGEPSVTP